MKYQEGEDEQMDDLYTRYPVLRSCADAITDATDLLIAIYKNKGTLLICGNGGSAADAEHISGELLKGFLLPRPLPLEDKTRLMKYREYGEALGKHLQAALPAVPVSSLTALHTAFANDCVAEFTFAQAVWGLAGERDALMAISTSGNSKNVVYAAIAAKAKGAKVVALTGATGGEIKQYADVCICVPEQETYKIQELHLPVYHHLCAELEHRFFASC